MAKMFYTLEEAAAKLGVNADRIKEMAAGGQLQQFRDRDKLMFKREQVDAVAAGGSSGSSISLSDDTDTVSLQSDDTVAHNEDSREATGVSVFDADEVEAADPAAQTQVTHGAIDDDLALESVGSGSGLLDLTRESDDTSLGAELLDEIYPGSSGDTAGESGAAVGSSGVFESAMASGAGQASAAGLGHLDAPTPASAAAAQPATMVTYDDGDDDPAIGSAGMLLGATIALVIALIVASGHVVGLYSPLAQTMVGEDGSTLMIWTAGLLVGSIVLGLVGMGVSKAMSR